MYLINELQGWAYAIWHIVKYPYANFMDLWWPIKILVLGISIYLCAVIIDAAREMMFDYKRFGFERYLVYAGRNIGLFAKDKRIQIIHYNPLRIFSKFWPEISHSKESAETILVLLIGFALLSKWLWFVATFKILLLILVIFTVLYVQIHGYVSLSINAGVIILCNLAYLSNFSIGFVDLTPHYTIHFWSWLHIHPVVVNPTDQDINLNKYIYALLLFSCYVSVLRYIGNHFYWKRAKHQPAPWARDFVGEPLDNEQDIAEALTMPDANTTPVEDRVLSAKEKRREAKAKQIVRGTNITGEEGCNLYFLAGKMVFDYQNEFGYSRKTEAELTKKLKESFPDLPFSFKPRRQMQMRRFYLETKHKPEFIDLLSAHESEAKQALDEKPMEGQSALLADQKETNTDIEPSNNDDINSYLKLLGFSRKSIGLIFSEFGAEAITQTLDVLKASDNISNPKIEFLKLLEINHGK